MRWYVPYMLSPLLYGRFPCEAVECYTLDTWVNTFPLNIVCLRGEGRLSLFSVLISLCRQQAWRGQPFLCTLKSMLTVNPLQHITLQNLYLSKQVM